VSWKAYCFVDDTERDVWREHSADLELTTVLGALVADLERRGHAGMTATSPDLGRLLLDEYVRFPAPAA
jgi:hypothetical protein